MNVIILLSTSFEGILLESRIIIFITTIIMLDTMSKDWLEGKDTTSHDFSPLVPFLFLLSDEIERAISLSILLPTFVRPLLILGNTVSRANPRREYNEILYLGFSSESKNWTVLSSKRGENKRARNDVVLQQNIRNRAQRNR